MKTILVSLLLLASASAVASPLQLDDVTALNIGREGLIYNLDYMKKNKQLFSGRAGELLDVNEKETVLTTWASFQDYIDNLEALADKNGNFALKPGEASESYYLHVAAFYATYHHAMKFIEIVDTRPDLEKLFNEAQPKYGIEKGSYQRFKAKHLNPVIASHFVALEILRKSWINKPAKPFAKLIQQDKKAIWKYGRGKGIHMTLEGAGELVKKAGFTLWFPVQKNVANGMGHVRVARVGDALVSPEQVNEMIRDLEAGDILLERREWYLTNMGIPGFWPHAALFIGTAEHRIALFDADEQVQNWVKTQGIVSGNFETLLNRDFPKPYEQTLQNKTVRVIEAIAAGVILNTMEESVYADSVAALRPRLSKLEKAKAIYQAFSHIGKPYDYNFDFITDAQLVCTELIFKAYQPATEKAGLQLPLKSIAGRNVMPANLIAQMFTEEHQTEKQQLDLVFFYDGNEGLNQAVRTDIGAFLSSWERPKWHIVATRL